MTRRLYIHVGPRKTATSTIQRALATHDNSVVLYPKTGRGLEGPGQIHGHHGLVVGFFGKDQNAGPLMETLAAECRQSDRSILLSAEILESRDIAAFVHALLDRLDIPMEVELLVACREHFSRAASLYKHRTARWTSQESRMPDQFLLECAPDVCYASLVRNLRRTGLPITALNYHPSSDWVERFLTHIGFSREHLPAIENELVAPGAKMLVVNLALKKISSPERRRVLLKAFRRLRDKHAPSGFIFGPGAADVAGREFAADRRFLEDEFGIQLVPPRLGECGNGLRISAQELADIAAVTKDFGTDGETIIEFATTFLQPSNATTVADSSARSPAHRSTPGESVRLVVWDLDETFWRGTLTEGGISEYVQKHHDAVIELAHRGIMSSICSRNNPDQVLPILKEKKILDYFIFPSISWQPKGVRLAALIESVQLRPTSVMFIDDNPGNLAEARAVVPGIQVEGADFIARMLEDPRFSGKNDSGMARLAQYKLLETRKHDEVQYSGDNFDFLRGCDIRVCIEHDVLRYRDRAIELINRTNQLNYTKNRLPEDLEKARAKLMKECGGAHRQAGLVRVVDKYGDYGFVGFYLMRNRRTDPAAGLANQTLVHYCFSCRTLGMFVEQWLYELLRRPALSVVGEVLTDLNETRTIDWIRLVPTLSEYAPAASMLAPEIRVSGGCEANSVAHYLGAYCGKVAVTGNFQAGALFIRLNSCFLLLSAVDHTGNAFDEEMALLGIPAPLMGTGYFRDAPEGTVFVFSGSIDAFGGAHRVRHRLHGWEIHATSGDSADFISSSDEDISRLITKAKSETARRQLEFATRHIRENYETVGGDWRCALQAAMEELVQRVPDGCKLVFLLDDERRRSKTAGLRIKRERIRYNEWVRSFVEPFPFVGVAAFADAIRNEDEILHGGNHYDRMVYWRAAETIVEVARQLAPRKNGELRASMGDSVAGNAYYALRTPRSLAKGTKLGLAPPARQPG